MAQVTLVETAPQTSQGGAAVAVRLAGGGARAYTHKGFNDWLAGVAAPPRFTALAGWDDSGPNGDAIPQTAAIVWFPSNSGVLSQLANLYWQRANIVISTGDDTLPNPFWAYRLIGKVADIQTDGGKLSLTISDLTTVLNAAMLTDTFAGTGDLEGGADAAGRVKRRSWGTVFNVEGLVLDTAYNIYEFNHPSNPIQGFDLVKDKGYPASSVTTVDWQGDALSTLNALRNATAPSGGGVAAPSIGCVKWWTQPSGPLTADLRGEVGAGFVNTMADITARLLSIFAPSGAMGNYGDSLFARPAAVGVHVSDSSETVANVLDRLILPMTCMWKFSATGLLYIKPLQWTGSIEALQAVTVTRDATFQPLLSRKLGFQRNYRVHSSSEISAAITATDVTYEDGTPIEVLKPAQAGADKTAINTASAIYGQGLFATLNSASYGSSLLTGFGQLSPLDSVYFGSSYLLEGNAGAVASLNAFKTALGIASAIFGQGLFATQSSADYGTQLSGLPQFLTDTVLRPGYFMQAIRADYITQAGTGTVLAGLWPAQAGADVTGYNIASAIFGQSGLATAAFGLNPAGAIDASNVDNYGIGRLTTYWPATTGSDKTGNATASAIYGQGLFATAGTIGQSNFFSYFTLNAISLNHTVTRQDGATILTESDTITQYGISAGFYGQGGLATLSTVGSDQLEQSSATDMLVLSNTNIYYGSGGPNTGTASGGSGGTISNGGSGGTGGGGYNTGNPQP